MESKTLKKYQIVLAPTGETRKPLKGDFVDHGGFVGQWGSNLQGNNEYDIYAPAFELNGEWVTLPINRIKGVEYPNFKP